MASVTTPYLAYRASGRQLAAPSTRGIPWGLALHNLKVAAVPVVLYGCVVALKNPHVPFPHMLLLFPSLSLLSCSLPDFYEEFLGKVLL